MLLACFILLQQPIHDEYAIVVSEAENKCREDDIDNIELNTKNTHDA